MPRVRNLLLSAVLLTSPAFAQQGGDLQAQILYAYQTEDAHGLANLIQNLRTQIDSDGADAALRYHMAHAQYRMGLLSGRAHAKAAELAFDDCIDELKPLVLQDVKSAEALALQSACYAELAGFTRLEAALLRSRSADRLKAAMALEPRNPRVVFLSAMQDAAHAKPGTIEQHAAFAQLQLAVRLFDESSATGIDTPGWGHAEAYLALGRELKSRGDRVGARNLIEKSLIVAPEYKAAQRQLSGLVRP
jgi:hypothetical protein